MVKRTSFFAHILMLSAYVIFPFWLVFLQSLATFSIPPESHKSRRQPMNVERDPCFGIAGVLGKDFEIHGASTMIGKLLMVTPPVVRVIHGNYEVEVDFSNNLRMYLSNFAHVTFACPPQLTREIVELSDQYLFILRKLRSNDHIFPYLMPIERTGICVTT